MAPPAIPTAGAVAQHLAQAQHTTRPRPAGSTSSSERAADPDEAPPGTTDVTEAESESRRMGAAALMQHEWQPAGNAPPSEPAQTHANDAAAMDQEVAAAAAANGASVPDLRNAASDDVEDAQKHAGVNGFAEGHGQGMLSDHIVAFAVLFLQGTVSHMILVCCDPGNGEDHTVLKRGHEDIEPDEDQAAKRTRVSELTG